MDIQTVIQQVNDNLAKMNVPINRRDASRHTSVHWLLHNLHVRNKAHAKFKPTMYHLLALAERWNLMSAKERNQLEKSMNHIVKKLTPEQFQQWLSTQRIGASNVGAHFMSEKMQGIIDHDVEGADYKLALDLIQARYVGESDQPDEDAAGDERFALPA